MLKRQNPRIYWVEEETELQTKGIGNLFSEIITENVPNLSNNIDTHVQETFQFPNAHD
jgi:hypothetical protein